MASDKIIIYQIFSRLYGYGSHRARKPYGTLADNGCGKMNDFTPTVLRSLRSMGVSHVWFTGIIRHATTTDYSAYGIPRQHPAVVKGKAGSPYAITDYYDVDPDLAVDVAHRMDEFHSLVNRTHRAGLKVVIDFVPNHVARQYKSTCKPEGISDLGEDDDTTRGFDPEHNNFYYCTGQAFTPYLDLYHGEQEPYTEMPAKATGNDCFHNAPGLNDWYETVKLNYGVDYYAGGVGHFDPVPSTWHKMLHILLFWADKGVDAFRCDMAEMVPAEFWAWATSQVKEKHPDVKFIGEVYNPQQYRRYIASGFDFLYDKVGMYDAMRDVTCHRRDVGALTWAWQQTDDIRRHMLYFLENHDEQRIASDMFAGDGSKGVPALIASVMMGQGPFMLYFGQEWGERGMDAEGFSGLDGRTTIFDYWTLLPPEAPQLTETYRKVLGIARSEKAVGPDALMFDLMYVNPQLNRQYAFMRCKGRDVMLVAVNFDDTEADIQLTVPAHAFDYMKLKERTYQATELLTGNNDSIDMKRDGAVSLSIAPRSGVIIKLK